MGCSSDVMALTTPWLGLGNPPPRRTELPNSFFRDPTYSVQHGRQDDDMAMMVAVELAGQQLGDGLRRSSDTCARQP